MGERTVKDQKSAPRKSGRTRTRILDAAIGCIVTDGYGKLTMAGTAERAGITRSALVYHFPNREPFLVATVEHLFDLRLSAYFEAVRDVRPGPGQIDRFVEIYCDHASSPMFTVFIEIVVAARTDAALHAIVEPALDRFDAARAAYAQRIFTDEMRAAAGDRYDTMRDFARFLIEGMAFTSQTARIAPIRRENVRHMLSTLMTEVYGADALAKNVA